MTQPTELEPTRRLSRRTVVKGGLVAGGALWVAPIVTGLGVTAAHADGTSGTTPPPSGAQALPSHGFFLISAMTPTGAVSYYGFQITGPFGAPDIQSCNPPKDVDGYWNVKFPADSPINHSGDVWNAIFAKIENAGSTGTYVSGGHTYEAYEVNVAALSGSVTVNGTSYSFSLVSQTDAFATFNGNKYYHAVSSGGELIFSMAGSQIAGV